MEVKMRHQQGLDKSNAFKYLYVAWNQGCISRYLVFTMLRQGFDLYGVVSKFGTPIHPMVYQFVPFILPSLIIVGYPQSLDKAKTIAYS